MKINFLLLAIIIATISSCSTSYKTGQTPDDVYYSPARFEYDSVRTERKDDNTVYDNSEDREIRRRVYNRRNRRYDDRYDDRYNPYGYNYPYGGTYPPVYGNPKYGTTPNSTQPRKTNLGAYSPNTKPDSSNASNSKFGKVNNTNTPTRTFGNNNNSSSNNGSGVGNFIKRVFTNSGSSNTNSNLGSNNSSPSRTFETKTTTSSSVTPASSTKTTTTESKTSGSAPVRKF